MHLLTNFLRSGSVPQTFNMPQTLQESVPHNVPQTLQENFLRSGSVPQSVLQTLQENFYKKVCHIMCHKLYKNLSEKW